MEFLKNQRKALTGLFVAAGMLVSASAFAASQCSSAECSIYPTAAKCTTKAMTTTGCSGSGSDGQQCVQSCYWDTSTGMCTPTSNATWQECAAQ